MIWIQMHFRWFESSSTFSLGKGAVRSSCTMRWIKQHSRFFIGMPFLISFGYSIAQCSSHLKSARSVCWIRIRMSVISDADMDWSSLWRIILCGFQNFCYVRCWHHLFFVFLSFRYGVAVESVTEWFSAAMSGLPTVYAKLGFSSKVRWQVQCVLASAVPATNICLSF